MLFIGRGRRCLFSQLLCGFLATACASPSSSSSSSRPADPWIARAAIPLEGWPRTLPPAVAAQIQSAVATHRFVALGEGDHFVEDKYVYRLALLRPLVLDHGVRQMAMEMGGSDAGRIDRYLETGDERWLDRVVLYGYRGETDPERRELAPFAQRDRPCEPRFWSSEKRFWRAVRALSEEGRDRGGDRIRLFGFDFDANPGGGFEDARRALDGCSASPAIERLRAELTPPSGSSGMNEVARIEGVRARLLGNRAPIASACGDAAVDAVEQDLELLAFSYRTSMEWAASAKDMSAEGQQRYRQMFDTRERHMHQRMQVLLGALAPDARVVLLAHDMHVARSTSALRYGAAPHDLPMWPSIGARLEDGAKGSVYGIWLLYGTGTRLAPSPDEPCEAAVTTRSGSLEESLATAAGPYFLPLRDAPAGSVVDRALPFGTPTSEASGPIRASADAIVFLPTASATGKN